MASNVELITGHGESDHISSFDMRAANRATFGRGKYIFDDAENMATSISATELNFVIKSGSCMWSGMHIRIEESESVAFVSPASTDTIYIWLHYIRDASSLVESVEFVATTSIKVDSTLIYDELSDNITEAYTLFYSFTFNPNTNTVSSLKSEFTVVSGMNDFYNETTQRLNAQAAANAQQLDNLSNEVEEMISGFEGEMLNAVYDVTKLGFVYLNSDNTEKTLTLSELATNFKALIIQAAEWPLGFTIPIISKSTAMCRTEIDEENEKLWINRMDCVLQDDGRSVKITGNRAQFYRDSLGYKQVIYGYPDSVGITIYGIGRVAE